MPLHMHGRSYDDGLNGVKSNQNVKNTFIVKFYRKRCDIKSKRCPLLRSLLKSLQCDGRTAGARAEYSSEVFSLDLPLSFQLFP